MKRTILFSLLILCVCLSPHVFAQKNVELVTSEFEPYIGMNLLEKGYVYELVIEAFQRVGYNANISFYPLARAVHLAATGGRDGVLPMYYDQSLETDYVFSDPFPGGRVGLLKRKDFQASYGVDPMENQTEALRSLSQYRFGIVRDAVYTPEFDAADFLRKDEATDDMMNLEKLLRGRTDFVIIDKYTAADIMVHKMPHLIGQLEFMEPLLAEKPFHIAFSKKVPGYQQFVEDFNRGLQEVIADQTLEQILYKHGLLETAAAPLGKTIIRIGTVDNPDMVIMQRLSKEYEQQHPEIALEWKVLDENVLRQRLLSDLAVSDGKFDIMTIGAFEAPIWAERGWILPIQDLPGNYDLNDVLQPLRDSLSYDGNLYAVPFYAESTMTYYRKDLFKQAGLIMPDAPTYSDIKKFAAAIHNPADQMYGICLRGKPGWGENMAYLTILVNTFGGRWFDENWRPTIDSPEWKEAITFYQDLVTHYGPPNASSNGFTENLTLFANGQCSMWIDATVAAGMLFNPKISKVSDKLGFAQTPVAVTPKGSHWLWTWALAMPSSSKVPQEALNFLAWATSKEYIELVARHEGWVSVPPGTRISTYQNENYKSEAPFSDFVLTSIQTADPNDATLKPTPYTGVQFVAIPEFPAIGTQVGQIMARMLDGTIPIDQALKEAQRVAFEQMRASGYIK